VSEESYETLLLEEYKNVLEHSRFLETKRDRFVIGSITASGAVLALIAQIFSKEGFLLQDASIEFIIVLTILCFALSLVSLFLKTAYLNLAPIIQHHEIIMRIVREIFYDKKFYKLKDTDKNLVDWMDTRANCDIINRSTTLSKLSERILCCSCGFWFLVGIIFIAFLFIHCSHCLP
jgi:hypothetical protein